MPGRCTSALCRVSALLLAVLSMLSMPVFSATVIDILSMGHSTQLLSNDYRARMDLPGEDGYMLVDYRSQGVLMVVPDKQQVIDMGEGNAGASAVATPRVELKPLGKGPQIAGYETTRYSLSAQGQNCGFVFGSQAAMRSHEMSTLFSALKSIVDSQRSALGSFAAFMDACTLATMDFAAHADVIGIPMRMLDTNGKLLSEIKNIDTNADVPAAMFEVPRSYKVVAMNGELAQAAESVSSVPRNYSPKDTRRYKQPVRPYPYY